MKQILADANAVMHYTRMWLHYGMIGFVVLFTLAAALRGINY